MMRLFGLLDSLFCKNRIVLFPSTVVEGTAKGVSDNAMILARIVNNGFYFYTLSEEQINLCKIYLRLKLEFIAFS